LTIKFGNEQIRTHPLNLLLLKREGDLQSFEPASAPSLPKRRGQGDEFKLKSITELESQNSLCKVGAKKKQGHEVNLVWMMRISASDIFVILSAKGKTI